MKLSFVIPCYGSEKTIANVVDEIRQRVSDLVDNYEYEIIMVNDASPDNVWSVIESICKNDPIRCKGISMAKNFGQHSALLAGYRVALGDLVMSLDDDGQAPLEALGDMLTGINNGADVVFGSYEHKMHNVFRNIGSKINNFMVDKLLNKPKKIQVTSFFIMRKFVVEEIIRYNNAFPYLLGLIFRTTKNIVNIPVEHRARTVGRSGYTFRKLLGLWVNGFTAFSVVPLRFATFSGIFCAVAGFILAVWVVVNKFIHPEVPAGYSSIMAAIFFVGGMLMMLLGLVGEYVGRIYICINKAPQYVIRKQTFSVGENHER